MQKGWCILMSGMEVLIDTNIVLDWILDRVPFNINAEKIISLCAANEICGHLASHTLLNIFYITRRHLSVEERKEILLFLCKKFNIIGIDKQAIVSSLQNKNWNDLEDGLQMQCAFVKNLDYIITRDLNDFQTSKVQVLLPDNFLEVWGRNAY